MISITSFVKGSLLCLTVITLLSSCSKTESRKVPAAPTATESGSGDSSKASSDTTTAASGDATVASGDQTTAASGDTTAASGDATKPASGDVSPATPAQPIPAAPKGPVVVPPPVQPPPAKPEPAQPEPAKPAKPEVAAPAKPEVPPAAPANAGDGPSMTLAFKDVAGLKELAQKPTSVVFHQKVQPENEVLKKLLEGNEDHFCKVVIKGDLKEKDILKLDDIEQKVISQAHDAYLSVLQFKGKTADVNFECKHTTSNLFIYEFARNFSAWITLRGLDGKDLDTKEVSNPRTENRMVNVIKLVDMEKLEKVTLDEAKAENFAVTNGAIDSSDKLANFVAAGKEKAACMVVDRSKDLLKDVAYILVEKTVSETPADIKVGNTHYFYRADEKNFVVLSCVVQKSASFLVLTEAFKGLIQFGALPRLEYNKKFDEIKALHEKLNPPVKQD